MNNNKQLLLSKYISSQLSAQWRRCMFTAWYELDVTVLCSRIRTLTDLLHIFKRGSTCGQFISTHKLNLYHVKTVNSEFERVRKEMLALFKFAWMNWR